MPAAAQRREPSGLAASARTRSTGRRAVIALSPRAWNFEPSISRTAARAWPIIARLTSASSGSASVSAPSGVTPLTQEERGRRSGRARRGRRRADERPRQRCAASRRRRSARRSSLALVPTSSITGRQLVMIVSGRPSSRMRRATKYAVDEESRKTLGARSERRAGGAAEPLLRPRRRSTWAHERVLVGRDRRGARRRRACGGRGPGARARRGRGARSSTRCRSAPRAQPRSPSPCCAAGPRSQHDGTPPAPDASGVALCSI